MNSARRKYKANTFLEKTYTLVSQPIDAHIVSWTIDGSGFAIFSIPDFTEVVLPKYFKHSNFASFVRQLNMYGFHKVQQDGCENVFKHPLFLQGKQAQLMIMKRKSVEMHEDPFLTNIECEALLIQLRALQKDHTKLENTVKEMRLENRGMSLYVQGLEDEIAVYKERKDALVAMLTSMQLTVQMNPALANCLERDLAGETKLSQAVSRRKTLEERLRKTKKEDENAPIEAELQQRGESVSGTSESMDFELKICLEEIDFNA